MPVIVKRNRKKPVVSLSMQSVWKERESRRINEPDSSAFFPWIDSDGNELNAESAFSAGYAAEGDDNGDVFFYLPKEKNGFTVYSVDRATMVCTEASSPHQFQQMEDAQEIARILASRSIIFSTVREAAARGKGRNAASIILYSRNSQRTDSLIDYRNKMRQRQMPLRVTSQWEWFVRMIEENKLTAGALKAAMEYAEDIENTRADPNAASDFNAEDARIAFIDSQRRAEDSE